MTIPDETLMAYADGELEPAERAEVETAMAADPAIAARVEQHRALRRKLSAAYDPILMETVPNALVATVHTTPAATPGAATGTSGATASGATITDLRRVRAARAAEAKEAAASARRAETPRRPWTWFEWSAMAASIAAGAVIAHLALNAPDTSRIGTNTGRLVAQGDLEQVLSRQLASDQPADAPVQIGLSFKSKSGDTCRTFTLRERDIVGGLACREDDKWHVQVLANVPPNTNGAGNYKPAGGNMPPAVLAAVEQQIEGEALDASGEAAARARGWQ
jgi:anti-sigma factor RsiW